MEEAGTTTPGGLMMGFLLGCLVGGGIMTVIVGALASGAIDGEVAKAFQEGLRTGQRSRQELEAEAWDWSRP